MCVSACVCERVCLSVCECMFVWVYVCVCVYLRARLGGVQDVTILRDWPDTRNIKIDIATRERRHIHCVSLPATIIILTWLVSLVSCLLQNLATKFTPQAKLVLTNGKAYHKSLLGKLCFLLTVIIIITTTTTTIITTTTESRIGSYRVRIQKRTDKTNTIKSAWIPSNASTKRTQQNAREYHRTFPQNEHKKRRVDAWTIQEKACGYQWKFSQNEHTYTKKKTSYQWTFIKKKNELKKKKKDEDTNECCTKLTLKRCADTNESFHKMNAIKGEDSRRI